MRRVFVRETRLARWLQRLPRRSARHPLYCVSYWRWVKWPIPLQRLLVCRSWHPKTVISEAATVNPTVCIFSYLICAVWTVWF
ncbi:Os12g0152750 [Oryza sativa Japonica Group]|uniref:Os12g0152750 protein n=1 Tax=Oryza sativa subsp. japonica TaxID=39947 RepID=A0A0P0Y726_ORYSJ|nr:hypothetical protein EE612_057842 [Oryza sativa]BAT15926.1 Os12g0152750 [Oryza sativa Japonica Group]